MKNIEHFHSTFNSLRADNLHILDNFYAANVHFIDPIGEHKGLEDIKAYYKEIYKNVESIRFDFADTIKQDDKVVLVWKMTVKARSLNFGKPVEVAGTSILRLNHEGLVEYHRDYFDMGEFIYETIPGLNLALRFIKKQLQGGKK